MADKKNCPKPESHKIAASYQNKGTLKTLRNIVRHRGFFGLYTGFNLHLCKPLFCSPKLLCVALMNGWAYARVHGCARG